MSRFRIAKQEPVQRVGQAFFEILCQVLDGNGHSIDKPVKQDPHRPRTIDFYGILDIGGQGPLFKLLFDFRRQEFLADAFHPTQKSVMPTRMVQGIQHKVPVLRKITEAFQQRIFPFIPAVDFRHDFLGFLHMEPNRKVVLVEKVVVERNGGNSARLGDFANGDFVHRLVPGERKERIGDTVFCAGGFLLF